MDILARTLPIGSLHESPWNPRKHFPEQPLAELTESVRRLGILSPLLIRPMPADRDRPTGLRTNDQYEIAAGHRRLRAAKRAALIEVPCIIRDMADQEFLEILTIENLAREDVHPLDEGEGYRTLMEKAGYDVDTVAAKAGKSKAYIYARLKLADLVESAKNAFLADELTAGHAILIARLQPKDQAEALKQVFDIDGYAYARRARGDGPRTPCSVRELGDWIQRTIHLDLHGAPWKKDDATLLPAAGPCTTCPKRTGFAPDLFPDLAKKDQCTDRACFQAKAEAFLARKMQAAAGGGTDLVRLSGHPTYAVRTKLPGVLYENQYMEAKARSCPHAQAALVVDGPGLGQEKTVCARQDCKIHRARHSYSPSPAELVRRREAAQKQERTERIRTSLHAAIREKVTAPLPRPVLELIARRYFDDIWHELRVKVMRLWGWIEKGNNVRSEAYGRHIVARLAKLTNDELARFLADLAVAQDLHVSGYDTSGPDALKALAKHYRVDPGKIERAITRELAEKRKAQAARAKKPARVAMKGNGKPGPAKKAKPVAQALDTSAQHQT